MSKADRFCVPVILPTKASRSKCSVCRDRSVSCEWGQRIPRLLNPVKIAIHKDMQSRAPGHPDVQEATSVMDKVEGGIYTVLRERATRAFEDILLEQAASRAKLFEIISRDYDEHPSH